MTSYRLAALFLALALPFLSPGSTTAGWDEGVAAYQQGDYHAAFREFMPLAVAGDPSAQSMIGVMYHFGEGVPQSSADAVRWYRMAADHGHPGAQLNLGVMYASGQGVPQNYAEAARRYHMAATQGEAKAQFNLGALYGRGEGVRQDFAEAARWHRRAAEQGHAEAQYALGGLYYHGERVSQNYAEAARWFRRAADQDVVDAQFSLGWMYNTGKGALPNYAQAARWLRRAAEKGNAKAQGALGLMYMLVQGVPQDDVQAYMWLTLAAAGEADPDLRDIVAGARESVAARLSPAQHARAQETVRNWRPRVAARADGEASGSSHAERSAWGWLRVMEVQQSLAGMGYDPGPADGVMGQRTRAALRAFEADFGLPVDGEISDRLIAALTNSGAIGRSAAAHTAAADPGGEGTGVRPWERYVKERRLEGTGTGFAVSRDGQIVTNHHVVAECAEVRVRPAGQDAKAGAVVARDAGNDLALLKAPVRLPVAAIREDRGGIRAGDSVVAVGFPLPGLLASEANVTTGTVSALAGIGNDTRFLQMTVPVQPGNSGGPLLDLEGRVVGVVVGKLDAVKVASVTGDIPQNVNFAIKAGILRSFLDASAVGVARRDPLAESAYPITLSPASVGADAKAFTVMVECWK